ncbi:MAG TPA: hypothetical protein G4N92_04085 [Anaerolineae bacterium]|nr:hypothetical protein [Anaerolineae bacterium]
MKDKRYARVLAGCLQAIEQGKMSMDECLQRYHQYREELQRLLIISDMLHNAPDVAPDLHTRRAAKFELLNSLPTRNISVTKLKQNRSIWQTNQKPFKKRFAMSWVIIMATVLSLFSGAGAVYASSDAIPGDLLYPVKTAIEEIQLGISDDETDTILYLGFMDERLDEIAQLISDGDLEDIPVALDGYQNHLEQLTKLMSHIRPDDPVQSQALEAMLQTHLQEQSQVMNGFAMSLGEQIQLREQLQEMSQTATQLHLQIENKDKEEETQKPEGAGQPHKEGNSEMPSDGKGQSQDQSSGSNQQSGEFQGQLQVSLSSHGSMEEGQYTLTFQVNAALEGNLHALVNGEHFACALINKANGLLECKGPAPIDDEASVMLYKDKTGELLFSQMIKVNKFMWGQSNEQGGMNGQGDGEGQGCNDGQGCGGGK